MEQIKKIDIHAHASYFADIAPTFSPTTDLKWPSAEIVLDFYEKLGVEKGILQPIVSPEKMHAIITNEEVITIVKNHPDRFLWFCDVDPRAMGNTRDTNLGHLLEYYKSLGAIGCGEITANMHVDDPLVENLFGYCAELGLPVTIHLSPYFGNRYGLIDEVGLRKLEGTLKKFPKLKVIGHSQPFWREIGDNPLGDYPTGPVKNGRIPVLLRKYENLYCDLSGDSGSNALMRDREYAAKFVEEFSDRLMYACDICSSANTFPFKFNDFLDSMRESGEISEANYRKIVRENAIRFFNLPF